MKRAPDRDVISTKQEQIAKQSRHEPKWVLTTLAHQIDVEWRGDAYRHTRKDGAVGVDGVTAQSYEERLEENLSDFWLV